MLFQLQLLDHSLLLRDLLHREHVVLFAAQIRPLLVELGASSATMFTDTAGRIYQPDEAALLTEITSLGSSLLLSPTNIGSSSTIVARNLWISTSPGDAAVNHVVWTNTKTKQWTVLSGSIGQGLIFIVGDLAPHSAYLVRKTGAVLADLNSDSLGQLRFSDTAISTVAVVYSIDLKSSNTPAMFLPVHTAGNILNLWWFAPSTGSVLQGTATLNPPHWVDVITNNSVAGWENYLTGPMSNRSTFFRLKQLSP